MKKSDLTRRQMLQTVVAATAGLMAPPLALGQDSPTTLPTRDRLGELLPKRKLGKTGAWVTMLGLGGHHLGRPSEAEAQKMIESALAGGVRFFDSAVAYQNGLSEERLGKYLTPTYRDISFLMTKSAARTSAQAQRELDDSLRRLKTDYIDLWQMHENVSVGDVNMRVNNGVVETFLDAQAKGKVKYIGFTGHTTPDSHVRMLDLMKGKNDPLQTCQMPINLADPNYNSFILKVLPALVERGYGVLAMKTLAGGGFFGQAGVTLVPGKVSVSDALHFVWSLPVSCLISGPDSAAQFEQTIAIARSFSGMSEQRRTELSLKVADVAGRGVEYYKG